MNEQLQQTLALLNKSAQVISALMEENIALKGKSTKEDDFNKKAENLASKTGLTFKTASAIIKEAAEKGLDADSLEKTAEVLGFRSNTSFGKVANEEKETGIVKTAAEKFDEGISEVLGDLAL